MLLLTNLGVHYTRRVSTRVVERGVKTHREHCCDSVMMQALRRLTWSGARKRVVNKPHCWLSALNRAGNANSVRCLASATVTLAEGLFGLQQLKGSQDFPIMARKTIESIETTKSFLQSHPNLAASDSLALLDGISADLCAILDSAELCRNVHQSDAFKQAAEEAFETLSIYMHKLNADDSLHGRLQTIMESSAWPKLTVEEQLFTENLRHEFESDGIHLAGKLRELLLRVKEEVGMCETQYSQVLHGKTVAHPTALVSVGPFETAEEATHLRSWVAQYVPQQPVGAAATANADQSLFITASRDRRIVSPLLSSIDHEPLRKQLWDESYHYPAENIVPLGQLIKSRQQLAKTLGYESYVHKVLYNKALRTPEEVTNLLQTLSDGSRQQAQSELSVLQRLKAKSLGIEPNSENSSALTSWLPNLFTNSNSAGASQGEVLDPRATLYPWDVQYFTSQYHSVESAENRQQREQINSRTRAQAKIKEYLSLEACIDGLRLISRELFGLELEQSPLGPYEGWLNVPVKDTPQQDARLQKYVVRDAKTGTVVGTVYLDLYARDSKFPGSAQFTVQCGCVRTHISAAANVGTAGGLVQHTQLPIVALVFHFKPPSTPVDCARHTLLSLQEVETLHHEWGHALHSLLSKTRFQHLSGTRGGTDFVEVSCMQCCVVLCIGADGSHGSCH
jgi:intermediate peptidase